MAKIYDKVYHLKGSGIEAGRMICSQCQKRVHSDSEDWLEAKKNSQGDWGYISIHRGCYPLQEGWEKAEAVMANRKSTNLNKLILLSDLVERLSEITDTTIPEVVDALEGVCWDEEDSGRIKEYHSSEDDV